MLELPVVHTPRSLVPGTTMTLPSDRPMPGGAERVVVVHRRPDGASATVGTVARVDGSTESRVHTGYLTVTGLHLAGVEFHGDAARVAPLREDRTEQAAALLGSLRRSVRRYMVVRAEAGEGGDIHLDLSADPVVASNQVASLLRVTWPEVQEVLEAGDAVDRLRRGAQVLERETALLEAVLGRSDR
jgi:hypothetical protein